MKRNQSLAQFQNIVVLDLVIGGIAFVIGLIVILLNSGYNLNLQAIGNGAILVYLGSGLLGLGVFSGFKSGTTALFGPTGGYLVGFLICVFLVGYLIEKG